MLCINAAYAVTAKICEYYGEMKYRVVKCSNAGVVQAVTFASLLLISVIRSFHANFKSATYRHIVSKRLSSKAGTTSCWLATLVAKVAFSSEKQAACLSVLQPPAPKPLVCTVASSASSVSTVAATADSILECSLAPRTCFIWLPLIKPEPSAAQCRIDRFTLRWIDTVKNKNVAIANRSCDSCAHSTSRSLILTPWPWNLG